MQLNLMLGPGLLVLSSLAFAQSAQLPNKTVVKVSAYGTRAVVAYAPPDTANGCIGPQADKTFVIDWNSDPQLKAMLSLVLLAKSTGGTIGVGISGCFNVNATDLAPLAYRIDLN